MRTAEEFVKSSDYLPAPLRDFHDAKGLFKTMHSIVDVSQNEYAACVSWITGQCYVIDIFLWFMAKRGWTLQRSRANVEFCDLAADIKLVKDRETEMFKQYMIQRKADQ